MNYYTGSRFDTRAGTDRKSVIDREESGTKNKDGGSFGKRVVTVQYNFDEF